MNANLQRRDFLRTAASAAGALWFFGSPDGERVRPHFAPRAKRVLHFVFSGAPSQHDLFDPKPALLRHHGTDLPDSVRQGQRITTMTSGQTRLLLAGSCASFRRRGASGAWISDLLPHLAGAADQLAIVRSMVTDAINHEPALNLLQTGSEQPGRPSLGAWLAWALGGEASDLPAFVVLHSSWSGPKVDQPLYSRLWGAGFLPAQHQGVLLRGKGDPVLFLTDPPGMTPAVRAGQLQALRELTGLAVARHGDDEANARAAQTELAFRMQSTVPRLVDLADEAPAVLQSYGPDAARPGTFARNLLLARRLFERGVRVVQVWHGGWDQHKELEADLPKQCRDVDQPIAAVLADLGRRGLLDDTLVVGAAEFGRTAYAQGDLAGGYGRDHHPRCFTTWLAGAGVRAGHQHGETCELGYNIVRDPVHVHDLNATVLWLCGFDHERLTFRHQGRDFRLTDVHGRVVRAMLA
ncbi:MAG: DUF1501 domain-containing protein [Planctomycetota bacterium]